ncbi:MAG: hypothetical protein J6T74_09205 [Clostridia bacterium]|nr:hypothetical protein [Clostridia bacterium]
MKKFLLKIKQNKKLKIIGIIITLFFAIFGVISFGFVVGSCANQKTKEVVATTPLHHTKPVNNVREVNNYVYYYLGDMGNSFYEYIWSLVDNGTIYANMGVDTFYMITMPTDGISSQKSLSYIKSLETNGGSSRPYEMKFQYTSSNDGNRLYFSRASTTDFNNGIDFYRSYTTQSLSVGSYSGVAVPKNSNNIGKWFQDAYAYQEAQSSGYTEEDLEEAYNNGYEVGYNEGIATGINPIVNNEIIIDPNYDFRRWFTDNIDNEKGIFQISSISSPTTLDIYNYCVGGDSVWSIGNRNYNGIVIQVQALDSTTVIKDKNGNLINIGNFVGNSNIQYYGLVSVYYIYQPNGINNESTWNNLSTYNYLTSNDTSYYLKVINAMESGATGVTTPSSIFLSYYNMVWTDNGFRYLQNFNSENEVMAIVPNYKTLTMAQLLALNDSAITNNDTQVSNVFTLFSQAFNSISSILNIQVLPNMTLGLLLSIPLIVTIILFIIKMLRK